MRVSFSHSKPKKNNRNGLLTNQRAAVHQIFVLSDLFDEVFVNVPFPEIAEADLN